MSITIHAVLHGIARPRTKPSIIKLRKVKLLRLARVVCLPYRRKGTYWKVGPMWTIARIQLPWWIQDDRSWARTVRVLLYSLRLFRKLKRNSVRCLLGGKCDLLLQAVC